MEPEDYEPFAWRPSGVPGSYDTATRVYYKLVAVRGGRYFSIYDGKTEYRVGQMLSQKIAANHGGGYYVRTHRMMLTVRFAKLSSKL
jgi:hypothetical protein